MKPRIPRLGGKFWTFLLVLAFELDAATTGVASDTAGLMLSSCGKPQVIGHRGGEGQVQHALGGISRPFEPSPPSS